LGGLAIVTDLYSSLEG